MRPEPAGDPEFEAERLEEQVPALADAAYSVESAPTPDYNCLAWAMGDCTKSWSPTLEGGYHWPDDLPIGVPVLGVVAELFRREGYAEGSQSVELEPGVEKVAIYADEWREVRHVARQLGNGQWASKMGDLADIHHDELRPIEGAFFGKVAVILERRSRVVVDTPEPPPEVKLHIVRRGRRQ